MTSNDSRLSGIDVSHFQGVVDWPKVKASGVTFAFAKATEGLRTVDTQFATNWQQMKAAGVVRGAYHFFHPDEDAAAQAAHFLSVVTPGAGDLPPVLDVEIAEGVDPAALTGDVQVWLDAVEKAVGAAPILYSGKAFVTADLPTGLARYPLWLAEYTDAEPSAPGEWERWTFWQHSQSGRVDGVSGDVDLDFFAGSAGDWNDLLLS